MNDAPQESAPQFARLTDYRIDEAQLQNLWGKNKSHKGILIAQGTIPVFLRLMCRTDAGDCQVPIEIAEDEKGRHVYAVLPKEQDFYALLQTAPDLDLKENAGPRIVTTESSTFHTRPCVAVTMREDGAAATDYTDCPYFQFKNEQVKHPARKEPMNVLMKRLHLRNVMPNISLLVCKGEERLRPRMVMPEAFLSHSQLRALGAKPKTKDDMSVVGMNPKEPIAAFSIELREPEKLPRDPAVLEKLRQLLAEKIK